MRTRVLAALALLAAPVAAQAPDGTLAVEVRNVRAARGRVHVDLCPEARFLKSGCPYAADVPARVGSTVVVLHGVPAGRYAVQSFLDENGNGDVDRNFLGVPKEGVGFSNDVRILFSAPRFRDAAFDYDGHARAIGLSLRYWLGPAGPNPK